MLVVRLNSLDFVDPSPFYKLKKPSHVVPNPFERVPPSWKHRGGLGGAEGPEAEDKAWTSTGLATSPWAARSLSCKAITSSYFLHSSRSFSTSSLQRSAATLRRSFFSLCNWAQPETQLQPETGLITLRSFPYVLSESDAVHPLNPANGPHPFPTDSGGPPSLSQSPLTPGSFW